MIAKRVLLTAQARRDVRCAAAWYRNEGGSELALRWVAALQAALGHIGAHPKAGSARYGLQLSLVGLRFWPTREFPFLIFYFEREAQVEVWRVLHAHRDIPTWMGTTDPLYLGSDKASSGDPHERAGAGSARNKRDHKE